MSLGILLVQYRTAKGKRHEMTRFHDWLLDHPKTCIAVTVMFIVFGALAITQAALESAGYRTVIG